MTKQCICKLITTYHDQKHQGRMLELDFCIHTNLAVFETVAVIAENMPEPPMEFPFTRWWHNWNQRPKFRDAVAMGKRIASPDDLIVIANADIVFTKPVLDLINDHLQPNEAWCMTCWDFRPGKGVEFRNVIYSQDCWIFRGPPRVEGGDFFFGVPGCDNRFTHEIQKSGYKICNPSKSVVTYHVHNSAQRTTTNKESHRVPPPYLYPIPHVLGAEPETKEVLSMGVRNKIVAETNRQKQQYERKRLMEERRRTIRGR